MDALNAQMAKLEQALARLTERERRLVIMTAGLVVLFFLFVISVWSGSALDRAQARIKSKTDDLNFVLQMQGEYKSRKEARRKRLQNLRGRTKLVKLVEGAAASVGVDIGQLNPEDDEPDAEGIVESRVQLRARDLSVDRLKKFMEELEKAQGVVVVKRLKVNKPYRKDTLEIDMTVATYRVQKS